MNTVYQKYIILSTYRSGTNLLTSLLNSHPRIVSHHEVFREEYFLRGFFHWKLLRFMFPVVFLRAHVFHAYPKLIKAVGFELQYDQARTGRKKGVWKHIQTHNDIKIIHLKRKNILATYLSYVIANKMKQWTTTKNQSYPRFYVELDPRECMQYFLDIRRYRVWCDMFFHKSNVLQVTYEDLVARQSHETARILEFLQLPQFPLSTKLKKQITQPIEESILNFDELKRRFTSGQWKEIFQSNSTKKKIASLQKTLRASKRIILHITVENTASETILLRINSLISHTEANKNLLLVIHAEKLWNRLMATNNAVIISTSSLREDKSIQALCDYIVDIPAASSPELVSTKSNHLIKNIHPKRIPIDHLTTLVS